MLSVGNKKKDKKRGDSEFFANNPGLLDDWRTSSALQDMDMEDTGAANPAHVPVAVEQHTQQANVPQGDGGEGLRWCLATSHKRQVAAQNSLTSSKAH